MSEHVFVSLLCAGPLYCRRGFSFLTRHGRARSLFTPPWACPPMRALSTHASSAAPSVSLADGRTRRRRYSQDNSRPLFTTCPHRGCG